MSGEDLTAKFNDMNAPLAKTLGIRLISVTKERIEAKLEAAPQLSTIPPGLHGGAIMAFADNLGGVGAFINMPEGATTSTIESKTNFLRPIPLGEMATAVATPLKIGRAVQVWETRISRADGKLAAVVTQTQIVKPAD